MHPHSRLVLIPVGERPEQEPDDVRQVGHRACPGRAVPAEYAHCRTNHRPSTNQAGIRSGMNSRNETRLHTRARGYSTMYAPSTPAIAPNAPINGVGEFGLRPRTRTPRCTRSPGRTAGRGSCPGGPRCRSEDRQEQHVAEQVQPAGVQEHEEQHRQGRDLVIARRARLAGPWRTAGAAGGHQRELLIVDQLARDRRVVVVERLLAAQRSQRRVKSADHRRQRPLRLTCPAPPPSRQPAPHRTCGHLHQHLPRLLT
jgi:hypothetical protein